MSDVERMAENGFKEYKVHLLKSIERLEGKIDNLSCKVDNHEAFKNKLLGWAIGSGLGSGAGIGFLLHLFG